MTVQPSTLPHPRRPAAITVICVISAIGALITIPLIFSDWRAASAPGTRPISRSAPWLDWPAPSGSG